MIKALIFLVVICSSISCTDRYKMDKEEKILYGLINEFAIEMKKEGLCLAGEGGAEKNNKISQVSVVFDVKEVMSLPRARSLIVMSAHKLLEIVNAKIETREYYIEYPASVKLLDLGIIGQPSKDNNQTYILHVILTNGTVCYCTDSSDPKNLMLVVVHRESFEEAVKKIEEEVKANSLSEAIL